MIMLVMPAHHARQTFRFQLESPGAGVLTIYAGTLWLLPIAYVATVKAGFKYLLIPLALRNKKVENPYA